MALKQPLPAQQTDRNTVISSNYVFISRIHLKLCFIHGHLKCDAERTDPFDCDDVMNVNENRRSRYSSDWKGTRWSELYVKYDLIMENKLFQPKLRLISILKVS